MTTSAMIDIETLDTAPSAVILSIGAVKFDPHKPGLLPWDKVVWFPSLEEQFELGRTFSDSTLEWWAKQDKDIRDRALSEENRSPLADIHTEINRYVAGVNQIWCQGPQFDMVIIENLYAQCNFHRSWQYYQIQDCRTVFNMMPVDPRKEVQQDLHDAGEDAYWQAVCLQAAFKHFGVEPR